MSRARSWSEGKGRGQQSAREPRTATGRAQSQGTSSARRPVRTTRLAQPLLSHTRARRKAPWAPGGQGTLLPHSPVAKQAGRTRLQLKVDLAGAAQLPTGQLAPAPPPRSRGATWSRAEAMPRPAGQRGSPVTAEAEPSHCGPSAPGARGSGKQQRTRGHFMVGRSGVASPPGDWAASGAHRRGRDKERLRTRPGSLLLGSTARIAWGPHPPGSPTAQPALPLLPLGQPLQDLTGIAEP